MIAALFVSCSPSSTSKKIYIVRHAEKSLNGDDPELSMAGKARATKLGQILADKDIKHIFSTDYIRTKSTAQPTATTSGVEIETYSPKNKEELIKKLKSLQGNILVIGHSNTISQLANEFVESGEKYPELDESEYNIIYEIKLASDGSIVSKNNFKSY